MCGFCNVWVCVCVRFVMCGFFGKMCTCIYCFCTVPFKYIYSYLFCLYLCKDCYHRVKIQLKVMTMMMMVVIIIIIIIPSKTVR